MSIQSDGEVEALFPITDPDEHERELVPYATVSPAVRDPNFSTEDRCPICGGTTDGLPCLQAPLEARIAAGEKLMSDQKPPERIWIQHYDDYAGIKKVGHGYYYWTKPQLDSDSIEYVPAATVAGRKTMSWDEATAICMMADCNDPQEHFCFKHCMEVYGTADERRVAGLREAVEWQPIETAPKNKKLLVGYNNPLGKWRTILASYHAEGTLESDTDESGFAPEGWYEATEAYEYLMPTEQEPTHWMPLPAARAALEGKE